ncbi:MAG: hypothetical protein ACFE85_12090 [Candidatus Hodarchaeota archaeon]
MELFQVFWDDQRKIFLEFKKNKKEQQIFLPESIQRLNLQYEISKPEIIYKDPPYLVSIKRLYHSDDALSFSIDLDLTSNYEDLQIKILRLIIFLYSGQRIEYSFRESFNISEIAYNDDCYYGYEFEDLSLKNNPKATFTQERIFEEIETNSDNLETKRTVVYEKKKIQNLSDEGTLISIMSDNNKTLKSIEEQLKNLAVILKNVSFNNNTQYSPIPIIKSSEGNGIERIKRPLSRPDLIQGQASSAKMLVIKEMKSIFQKSTEENSGFSIKNILKPMPEDELKALTLNEEDLKKKEEQAIRNQVERIKREEEKALSLENLSKPK